MFLIRSLTKRDIDFVIAFIKREGWHYLRSDIKRYFECKPKGCFAAERDAKIVGHIFSLNYGKTGWIGLLIVHPNHRRQGVGATLMRMAIEYVKDLGVETIRLEAVTLYQRLGFEKEIDSLRFCKDLKQKRSYICNFQEGIRLVEKEDLEELATFDLKYFDADRFKILECLYEDYPQYCFIAKEKQKVMGYAMARKTSKGYWLGPWICNPKSPNVAKKLALSCMHLFDRDAELRLGMPAVNSIGMQLMQELGFRLTSKSIRMFRGKHNYSGDVKGVYGIGGPEKG